MPDVRATSLLATLEKSNLLTSEQLDIARQEFATVEEARGLNLLESFVQRGWLTRWQAKLLFSGRNAFYLKRYKLLEQLGEGGMGSVFRAEDTVLKRIVAIKVIRKSLLNSEEAVARFRREIQAAASLNHPHIVAAYDADDIAGRHFLIMEYVAGCDLGQIVKQNGRLAVGAACECVRQAALGLQHAHDRGMVHRDIKPSNLLLRVESEELRERPGREATSGSRPSTLDSRPIVKILDMGLARTSHPESGEQTELTHTGQIVGTPDYISPEQARDTRSADIRSDIYSLGCTLYRLLTGRPPFSGAGAIAKITARLTDAPPRLRDALPDAPAALESVVLRTMQRDPAARYQIPQEVAQALAPFCDAAAVTLPAGERSAPAVVEPVVETAFNEFLNQLETAARDEEQPDTGTQELDQTAAGREVLAPEELAAAETLPFVPDDDADAGSRESQPPISRAGRKLQQEIAGRKRADRRRLLMVLSAVLLFVAAVIGLVSWQKAGETALIVEWPLEEREASKIEIDGRAVTLTNRPRLRFRGETGKRTLRLTRDGYEPVETSFRFSRGETKTFHPEWQPTAATKRTQRLAELTQGVDHYLQASGGRQPPETLDDPEVVELRHQLIDFHRQHGGTAESIGAAKQMARLPWPVDQLNREDIAEDQLRAAEMASRGGEASDSNRLADAGRSPLPELVAVLGDSRLKHWDAVTSVIFHPDGKTLVSSSEGGTIQIWNATTGDLIYSLDQESLDGYPGSTGSTPLAFSPDGQFLASGRGHGGSRIRLWNSTTGRLQETINEERALSLAFSRDGRFLALGNEYGDVKVHDLNSGQTRTFEGHTSAVESVAFSPDGRYVLSGSKDKTVRLWHLETGEFDSLKGHQREIHSVAFSPNGKTVASGAHDDNVKLWDINTGEELMTLETPGHNVCLDFSSNGRMLAIATSNHGAMVYDTVAGELVRNLSAPQVSSVAFNPDGKSLAVGYRDGTVKLCDVATGEEKIKTGGSASTVAVNPDGRLLAIGLADGTVRLSDLATGAQRSTLRSHTQLINKLAFSPDGKTLASASFDGTAQLWDVSEQRVIQIFKGHQTVVYSVAFHPHGRHLATGGQDGKIKVWDTAEGREVDSISPEIGQPLDLAFSPAGGLLAAGGHHNQLTVRRFPKLSLVFTVRGPGAEEHMDAVDFHPDGETLVTGSNHDDLLQLWNLRGQEVQRLVAGSGVWSTSFNADGSLLATAHTDGTVRLWDPHAKYVFEMLLKTLQLGPPGSTIHQVAFTPDGRHLITANGNGTIYVLRLQEWPAD